MRPVRLPCIEIGDDMNHCHLCGQQFNTFAEFTNHRATEHGHRIHPYNRTHRTREQIVEQAEQGWLRPYLIIEHSELCRCIHCIHRRMDELITRQEKSIGGNTNVMD
jgi:hypothetical protein